MVKKLIFIITLLILTASAMAYNQETNYNISELPAEGHKPLALQLADNYSIYLTQYKSDDRINLTFPEEYFYNSTNISQLNITYYIEDFTVTKNTTIELAINITSDHPGFSEFTYGFFFNIEKIDSLITENDTDVFYLLEGGWGFNISTNLLPTSRSKSFTLQGEPNSFVNITHCGTWLTCPENFTFDSEGHKTIEITIDLPSNASEGQYERQFVLKSTNSTRIGTVLINIVDPELIIEEYVYKDWCYESIENLEVCTKEQEDFERQRVSDILALARSKLKNMTEIVINETEVLVMTGSIDDALKSLYDSCVLDKDVMSIDRKRCNIDLEDLMNQREKLLDEIEELKYNQTQMNDQREADEKEESRKTRNRVIGITLVLIIAGLITWYIIWLKKRNFN